jgi:hypothetical protein
MKVNWERHKRWGLYGFGFSFVVILFQTYAGTPPKIEYLQRWDSLSEIVQSALIGEYLGMLLGGPIFFAFASGVWGAIYPKKNLD